jgi:hypothetical protein
MSPSAFTFRLSVPNDPKMVSIVGDMARHAAEYARLDPAVAAAFSQRAAAAAGKMLNGDTAKTTLAVFAAADGALTVTIGDESISQPLTS